MKNITSIFMCAILSIILFGCSFEQKEVSNSDSPVMNYELLELSDVYNNLEDLANDSTLVVEVKLTAKTEEVSYGGADFILTNATIMDVINGDTKYMDQEIKLFEVKYYHTDPSSTGDHFILFLDKYEGPVYKEEAFVITGVYQGKYTIDQNNNVHYKASDYNGIVTFQSKITPTTVDLFKEQIKSIRK